MRVVAERVLHQLGQIDRTQQTRAIRRQGLFAAGIGRADGFAIGEIVLFVDAVDEDHAGLGVLVRRAHDLVPQVARADGLVDMAFEVEVPVRVGLHRGHERVADQHREIEIGEAALRLLGRDELLDVGMIAGERRHHRAAARARAHDRAAHRVPHIHEGDGAGGIRADAFHRRALGAQRREVVADAAALLQRQRGLAQVGENPVHRIRDRAHDEAVEERDAAIRAGAGDDAAGGQEAMAGQRGGEIERVGAAVFRLLRLRQRQRDPRPGGGHIRVHGRAVRRFQPVFHVPDLVGNVGHGASLPPKPSG